MGEDSPESMLSVATGSLAHCTMPTNSRLAAALWAVAASLLSTRGIAAVDEADLGDLSLEQLMDFNVESVYGASRYEQRVTQAPSSITIITAEEIHRFGYTSFADVMRSVRGLYVSEDRNYSYLGVRGFLRPGDYSTRVLVLIDGHRMNDNIYDSGAVGRDGAIDVELIERVEFIRGPSSSVYGSSAFFGVINIVTKQGHEIDGFELAQEAGSLNTYRTRATSVRSSPAASTGWHRHRTTRVRAWIGSTTRNMTSASANIRVRPTMVLRWTWMRKRRLSCLPACGTRA